MKISIVLFLFAVLFLTSCRSSFNGYRVFEVRSDNVKVKNEQLAFENDTILITYNFWNQYGYMQISIFNKLNIPIYVDWKKSSFIANDYKYNYWNDEEFSEESSVAVNRSYLSNDYKLLSQDPQITKNIGSQVSSSSRIKPERVTFLPPKSYCNKHKFPLYSYIDIFTENSKLAEKDTTVSGKKIYYEAVNYQKQTSPLSFRNYITISISEDFKTESAFDHSFYISKYMILSQKYLDYIPFMPKYRFYVENKY